MFFPGERAAIISEKSVDNQIILCEQILGIEAFLYFSDKFAIYGTI